ncbi:hypothetical protein OH492_11625 [Vibrio chagasii]|nr:hypothetical protein [Vibrio chagasii]
MASSFGTGLLILEAMLRGAQSDHSGLGRQCNQRWRCRDCSGVRGKLLQ